MTSSELHWDIGTAYDLFVSLQVLHNPAEYGIGGVWAAGVRARIPPNPRKILEQSLLSIWIPYTWINSLPEPKDGNTVLWALRNVPPGERLTALAHPHESQLEQTEILGKVQARRAWDEKDQAALAEVYRRDCQPYEHKKPPSHQELAIILDWWSRSEEFGEVYLEALEIYHEVFFRQEEKHIRPALQSALSRAQEFSERISLRDLLEVLTQGVRFEILPEANKVVLAPSYWCTPFVYFGDLSQGRSIYLFGARPPEASLVPGEVVPDSLTNVLKALSDPTRLKILQYLAEKPLTPTQLSHLLRLRVPTVVHHLSTLRLAGLVRLTLGEEAVTKHYEARLEAVDTAYAALKGFINKDLPLEIPPEPAE